MPEGELNNPIYLRNYRSKYLLVLNRSLEVVKSNHESITFAREFDSKHLKTKRKVKYLEVVSSFHSSSGTGKLMI